MSAIGTLGTQVRLPDGRVATVVYNSLVGVGIKFGLHNPQPEEFEGTDGNTMKGEAPANFRWQPDALLRSPKLNKLLGMECICEENEVEILRVGLSG